MKPVSTLSQVSNPGRCLAPRSAHVPVHVAYSHYPSTQERCVFTAWYLDIPQLRHCSARNTLVFAYLLKTSITVLSSGGGAASCTGSIVL